ncbi:MAG: cytochrome c3 family protein [Myxococcota bacterium]
MWLSLGAVAAAIAAAFVACAPYDPGPNVSTFPLSGAHETLTCAECHGGGPPYYAFQWDATCLGCHEADRKPGGHHPGQACSNAGCHDPADLAWSDALNHDFLPLDGPHDVDCTKCHTTPSGPELSDPFATPDRCASCHEEDRYFEGHYEDDPLELGVGVESRWDCKACHDTQSRAGVPLVDWSEGYGGHADIKFPHATQYHQDPDPSSAWVVDCAECHPDGDKTVYTCTTSCHGEIFSISPHTGMAPGEDDGGCLVCHIHADIRPQVQTNL